jgi:hypothetical protein
MKTHRLLADLLAVMNLFLAVVIILFGATIGFRWAQTAGENLTFGAGMGLIGGLVVAALVCGLLAIASLIERHLRLIADDVEEMRARNRP